MLVDGLEAKFKLLATLPFDRRIGRKHMLVFGFVLDWYHSQYGDALASTRHIHRELIARDRNNTGLSLRHIHDALADLVDWGWLDQSKGVGRRASRYVPRWEMLSVSPAGNTTEIAPSVSPVGNTTVSPAGNTTTDSVSPAGNEDPLTGPGYKTGSLEREIDGAAAAAGLEPACALAGFDELWNAYGYRRDKKAARVAYARLAPIPEQHAAIVLAARAWCEAWRAQGNPNAPRRHLHKWLEAECWDEDPPSGYRPRETKAAIAPQPKTAPQSDEAVICGSDVDLAAGTMTFRLRYADREAEDIFDLSSADSRERLRQLCQAAGVDGFDDTAQLHGLRLVAQHTASGIEYAAPPTSGDPA
jgi:hypothetical protein